MIDYKNFDINAKTFCKLIEHKNFSKVASIMEVTQPTITRRIASLEELLNTTLVKRNTRTISFTTDGIKFYKLFKAQEDYIDDLIHKFRNNVHDEIIINLSVPMGIASHIISSKIMLFANRYDNLKINVIFQNRKLNIIEENIDIAILRHIPAQQTVKIRKIYSDSVYLYATPNYLKRHGTPKTLEETLEHNIIGVLTDDLEFYTQEVVEDNNKKIPYDYTHKVSINNIEPAINMAMTDLAIIPGLDFMYREYITEGKLVKVIPQYKFSEVNLYLARNNGKNHDLLEELTVFLEQCFR